MTRTIVPGPGAPEPDAEQKPTVGFDLPECECSIDKVEALKSAVDDGGGYRITTRVSCTAKPDELTFAALPNGEAHLAQLEFSRAQPALKWNKGRTQFQVDFRPLRFAWRKGKRSVASLGAVLGQPSYCYAQGKSTGVQFKIQMSLSETQLASLATMVERDGVVMTTEDLQVELAFPESEAA